MTSTKHILLIMLLALTMFIMSATPALAHGDEHDLEPTAIEKVISGVGVGLIIGYTIYVMGIRRRPSRPTSQQNQIKTQITDQDSA